MNSGEFYDKDKVDDAVLSLLYLTLHDLNRAWKGHDFAVMDRLHEKGLIGNPAGKTKSVTLTIDGLERCEQLFLKQFCTPETRAGVLAENARRAEAAWKKIPPEKQRRILSDAWCNKCETCNPFTETARKHACGHLIIEGACATCGGPVKFLATGLL